jgi:ankyrin repeat protein
MTRWILFAAILISAAAQDDAKEPLCRAAQFGDLAQVRALLAGGANPNVRDEQGETPLMRVALAHMRSLPDGAPKIERDYDGIAKLLLDKGADVNARDPSGRTALLIAVDGTASEHGVVGGDESIARLLVARGADVNLQDDLGWSPLLTVVNLWAEQPVLVDFLLAKGADINARLKDGRTGLMLAARLGKDERILSLLAKGADVNAQDNTGSTALMIAAAVKWEDQSLKMMKVLMSKGANPNVKDNQGRTAADRAAQAGYIDRATLLVEGGTTIPDRAAFMKRARDYALWRAIAGGKVSVATALLNQGADPNFRDDQGSTLLTIAASEEYSAEKAILLLDHGASVNLANSAGDTPLMVAVDRYQPTIVKALLDHGADANAVDRDSNTALIRAAASKHSWEEERKPLIHFLLEKGADPSRGNAHGVTALMLMALNGNPAAELLLEKKIDVDARDDQGNTALLYASRFFIRGWQKRIGWALLKKGANVNAANQRGQTALILAATQYEADGIQLLIEQGANVNARTKTGRTALIEAIDGPKEFDNDKHVVYSPEIAKLLIASGADVNARDAAGDSPLTIATRRGYPEMIALLEKAGAKP